ncbi:MAG: carboxypeptidase-like regulatory domain-containing protein [bacterium]
MAYHLCCHRLSGDPDPPVANSAVVGKLMAVLLLGCLTLGLFAQKQNFYFYGKVLDRETRAAILNVNIRFTGTPIGCTTNRNGEFSFFIDTIPVYMIITHLGYETQRIWLDNTSASISIMLQPASRMLKEVEIKAKNDPVPFFKDNRYSVLDYEVDSNRVYMLIYLFRLAESELLCKSVEGDTAARSGALPFRPDRLFLDCMGNMHVISADSAYQVYKDQHVLNLLYAVDLERFNKALSECVASAGELLFFRKISQNKLEVEFFHINRKTSEKQQLTRADDEENLRMLRRNPEENSMMILSRIPEGRDNLVQWSWVQKVLYKPNTSTLRKVDDILCVVNTADHTLELYDLNGTFTAKLNLQIDQVDAGQWTTEIYIDHIEKKTYTSFLKNGKCTLYRINLNTGELKRILTVSHTFPQKIRIHNNHLFYLYDLPGKGDNKHLFRQKL